MNLHEYQSKRLFADYGIPVPRGIPAESPNAAVKAAQELGGDLWVVKAQVHAGGRGKAGGVKLARTHGEVHEFTDAMLGSTMVTHQTGPEGLPVNTVYIEQGSDIDRELYLSMLVDREVSRISFIASAAGGMDIEKVAAETPEKIFSVAIAPDAGLQDFQARQLAFGLDLDKQQMRQFGDLVKKMYRLYLDTDASLIEVNPLITNKAGDIVALDGKINIDGSALFRQPKIAELRDKSQEDEAERKAAEHDLNYVSLDGNIACMVNGAGLAMATMDLIKLHGGEPANFLDVGGGATAERVAAAFKLILSNKSVEAILVNIFGGIVRCDLIAEGIVSAVKEVGVSVPVVVRLEGTNVDKGRELLASSGLDIIAAEDLTDAAVKVVAAAGQAK
ncbi:MAG: ADP-forming succinate--CoA ligase subunit beta [Gammaproteobacteria bacterium]|nr:ADP-forming succinate--CoA ligase subunit beta [Gammaproteobacteria bacterium]NNF49485.1 ADP-forming succinate--CoA ligase subunit beta [Woeseiaceae bacterium]MBT8094250.1 ADP-forming succinate--CoA ligase subunit beta [Gammaproteobacteria bacterium]MBT8105304.1 ADP-forming succinate--CoA ligase subunit beta [Gammaproteobacteria bacterium]NNK25318.1 ADP-forming succinate--CoA ligase subunit beta [Woeseiaceae bacterium]